jgi:ATP-dependent Clp protease adapter protein ClpS
MLGLKMSSPSELEEPEVIDSIGTDLSSKVILFNDEWHTFDEVINQIIKATGCSEDNAEKLTLEVHNKGKACVYNGELSECLKVSGVLEEIALHTQIEY